MTEHEPGKTSDLAKQMTLESILYERDSLMAAVQRLTAALEGIATLRCTTGNPPCDSAVCAPCRARRALQG